jgi:hypothetical protein
MPAPRQPAISSRWRAMPSSPTSANPAARITSARTPRSPHARAVSTTSAAGTAMIAISTGSGRSRTDGNVRMPSSSSAFGLTAYNGPVNRPATRLCSTSPPTVPRRRDAPTTTTDAGRSTWSTAACAAICSQRDVDPAGGEGLGHGQVSTKP